MSAARPLVLVALIFAACAAAEHPVSDERPLCSVDSELVQVHLGEAQGSEALRAPVGKPSSPPRRLTVGACGEKIVEDSTPWEHARRKSNASIVNGQAASQCEWRWQACLMARNGDTGKCFCGGTLIGESWILTAAHCLHDGSFDLLPHHVSATLGEYQHLLVEDGTEAVHHIKSIIRHPGYKKDTYENDVALLELEEPAVYGDCIGTACLPTEDVPENERCFVTGWGKLQQEGRAPQALQEAMVDVIGQSDCSLQYDLYGGIKSGMVCAQGERIAPGGGVAVIDSCQGDSGGPLVCEKGGKWTLHGVVSWGVGCANPDYPGVYARVNSYVDWISANTGVSPPPSQTPPQAVGAKGDPHLQNVHGQRFDLLKPGHHELLRIPRRARAEDALLVVVADAQPMGRACADMFFQSLDVAGAWAGGGLGARYSAESPGDGNTTGWVTFGKVDLKVTWGRTLQDIRYLNLFARKLSTVGFAVGGLLGEDDHTLACAPPSGCEHVIALTSSKDHRYEASTAEVV